jgi:hypothetical protein
MRAARNQPIQAALSTPGKETAICSRHQILQRRTPQDPAASVLGRHKHAGPAGDLEDRALGVAVGKERDLEVRSSGSTGWAAQVQRCCRSCGLVR